MSASALMPAAGCHHRFHPRTSGIPGAPHHRSRSQLQEAKESPKMPRALRAPAKQRSSLSAPPQPFISLFTLIKAVIEVTSQDGGHRQSSNLPTVSCPCLLASFPTSPDSPQRAQLLWHRAASSLSGQEETFQNRRALSALDSTHTSF